MISELAGDRAAHPVHRMLAAESLLYIDTDAGVQRLVSVAADPQTPKDVCEAIAAVISRPHLLSSLPLLLDALGEREDLDAEFRAELEQLRQTADRIADPNHRTATNGSVAVRIARPSRNAMTGLRLP